MDEKLWAMPELADYLRVHPSTVYRLLKQGRIPAIKIFGDWRFRKSTIDSWLDANETPAKHPA
jgi:excisionase family DNA binding protein